MLNSYFFLVILFITIVEKLQVAMFQSNQSNNTQLLSSSQRFIDISQLQFPDINHVVNQQSAKVDIINMDQANFQDQLNDARIQYGSQEQSVCSEFHLSQIKSKTSHDQCFPCGSSQISSIRGQHSFHSNDSLFFSINESKSIPHSQFYRQMCSMLDASDSVVDSFQTIKQYQEHQHPLKKTKKKTYGSEIQISPNSNHKFCPEERVSFQKQNKVQIYVDQCEKRRMSFEFRSNFNTKACLPKFTSRTRSQIHSSGSSYQESSRVASSNDKISLINLSKKVNKLKIQCQWEGGFNLEYTPLSQIQKRSLKAHNTL